MAEQKVSQYEQERRDNENLLFDLSVKTHVPSKYRVVDLETGDIWKYDGTATKWTRADDISVIDHTDVPGGIEILNANRTPLVGPFPKSVRVRDSHDAVCKNPPNCKGNCYEY
jgi:hypothetical protein